MTRNKLTLVMGLFMVLLLAALSACQAPTSTTKTTAKPNVIKLYSIFDLSGPYAAVMAPARDAFNDACEYVNTVQGGIKGVPVEFNIRDNGGKTDVTISNYEQLRTLQPKPLALFLCVSADGEALHDRVCEDKIVTIATPTQKSIYPSCYSFGWWPLYDEQFGAWMDWLMENWKENRPPKVAIVTWDSALGRAILSEPALAYAKKKGIEIVATETYGVRDLDCATQLTRVREKNPDWIFNSTTQHGSTVVLKSAKDLGYKIKLGSMCGLGEDSIKMASPEIFEGAVAVLNNRPWDDENAPSIKILNEWYTKKNRDQTKKFHMSRVPWVLIQTAAEAIGKTVDKVGWDKLDTVAVQEQMLKLKNFKPLNGLSEITFTQERPSPSKVILVQVKNGKLIPITDWRDAPYFGPGK